MQDDEGQAFHVRLKYGVAGMECERSAIIVSSADLSRLTQECEAKRISVEVLEQVSITSAAALLAAVRRDMTALLSIAEPQVAAA